MWPKGNIERQPFTDKPLEGFVMGKVTSIRWIKRAEDLRQIKAGPITIITGANLRKKKPTKADAQATRRDRGDDTKLSYR